MGIPGGLGFFDPGVSFGRTCGKTTKNPLKAVHEGTFVKTTACVMR